MAMHLEEAKDSVTAPNRHRLAPNHNLVLFLTQGPIPCDSLHPNGISEGPVPLSQSQFDFYDLLTGLGSLWQRPARYLTPYRKCL